MGLNVFSWLLMTLANDLGNFDSGIKNCPIEHVCGGKMALVSENIDISQLLYLAILAKYIVLTVILILILIIIIIIIIIFIPGKSLPFISSKGFIPISEKVLE